MLTQKQLEEMPAGTIFAQGEFIDAPPDYTVVGLGELNKTLPHANVADTLKVVRFVAVRGDVPDWAIYCQNPYYINSTEPEVLAVGYGGVWDWQKIQDVGDKIHIKENIRALVECSDEAYASYRH